MLLEVCFQGLAQALIRKHRVGVRDHCERPAYPFKHGSTGPERVCREAWWRSPSSPERGRSSSVAAAGREIHWRYPARGNTGWHSWYPPSSSGSDKFGGIRMDALVTAAAHALAAGDRLGVVNRAVPALFR